MASSQRTQLTTRTSWVVAAEFSAAVSGRQQHTNLLLLLSTASPLLYIDICHTAICGSQKTEKRRRRQLSRLMFELCDSKSIDL